MKLNDSSLINIQGGTPSGLRVEKQTITRESPIDRIVLSKAKSHRCQFDIEKAELSCH